MKHETLRGRWAVLLTMLLACVLCGVIAQATPAHADEKKETTTEQKAEEKADDKADEKADAAAADDAAEDAAADQANNEAAANLPEDATTMGNDVLWSDDKGDFVGITVGNDLIGCGETLNVSEVQTGGSVRLAARVINLDNAVVSESVTLAAQKVSVTGGSSTVAALAGETLTFTGETGDLYLAGATVYLDGTVSGDVHVYASELELGPHAQVAGTLKGKLGNDPKIDANAVVGANELKVEKEEAEEPTSLFDWRYIAASAASCLLIALLVEWLAGGLSEGAAALLKERPVSYLLWSILGIVVAPLVAILICIPVVTIPAGIACLLVLAAIALVSGGLTAAILGRLIAPKANRFLMAAIFGLLLGVGMAMPYVGAPLRCTAYAVSLGYVLCSMRKGMADRKERRAEEAIQF